MGNNVQTFVQSLLKSLGLKRKLTALFQALALIVSTTPQLAPFAPMLQQIASYLGVVGVVHAAASGTATTNKKVTISTVAAFLSAVLLVAQKNPALMPYVGLIQAVAAILGLIVHVPLGASKSK